MDDRTKQAICLIAVHEDAQVALDYIHAAQTWLDQQNQPHARGRGSDIALENAETRLKQVMDRIERLWENKQ